MINYLDMQALKSDLFQFEEKFKNHELSFINYYFRSVGL